MKLKICGLTTLRDIDCVNRAGVDFAGFVFARHRQQVTPQEAKSLRRALAPGIRAVGVFVNESPRFIRDLVEEGVIDWVQFHGGAETEMPCPAIRAFRMRSKADIKPTGCEYLLFDSFSPTTEGSAGKTFDWRLLEGYDRAKPFFIAGGIHAGNLRQAMALNPYGVDISSGVEENGVKSLQKILEVSSCIKTFSPK